MSSVNSKDSRERVHLTIDRLWLRSVSASIKTSPYSKGKRNRRRHTEMVKRQRKARTLVYEWLAWELELPLAACHVRYFSSDTCEQVLKLCAGVTLKEIQICNRNRRKER